MAPKILVVLTSHSKLGDTGKPTGWYLPELAHPYDVFLEHGASVTVASPAGGEAPLDPASVEAFAQDASSQTFLKEKQSVWKQTAPVSQFLGRAGEFDALFYPGGHGPMFDLAKDPQSLQLAAEFAEAGKVVAAVCHGPAALANVKTKNGKYLLEGKEVTGFSNTEEDQAQMTKFMPFLLETRLNEVGAKYVKAAEPWGEKVVVAGKVITGQNPASAKKIGEEIIKAVAA
ncbi:Glyoxalase 3 [Pleurostoma richardsiae]|uniref:D-lactate dehydratase n=1 Tax=Pleurostoma richardsiae TaxID=41990 RepID=A0AA38RGD7_9PEZI|nr:Glyoxalase 3 [Pleurostoma richardsiae]